MGAIKQDKLANSNVGLEITYGGKEAPFGGIDSSAPPSYIDPRCFVDCDGVLIIDNKIVIISTQSVDIPTLWSGTSGILLLAFGTFYNSLTGQLNYALGYKATPFVGPPSGVQYTFYITSWNPFATSSHTNDVLNVTLYDSYAPATSASITLPCIPSSSIAAGTGTGATGNITSVNSFNGTITGITFSGGTGYGVGDAVQIVPSGYVPSDFGWVYVTSTGVGGSITGVTLAPNSGLGYTTGAVTSGDVEVNSTTKLKITNGASTNTYSANAYGSFANAASIVSSLVSQINAGDPNVSAAASLDGTSITLTAKVPGSAGDAITVQDLSVADVAGQPPPYYFPVTLADNLYGGTDLTAVNAPRSFTSASTVEVGGTVYFANLGPLILKYSGPSLFSISSMYQGVQIIRKFGGSLIGLRVIPQLGFEVQNQDMIFAWTSALNLDEWNPEKSDGTVTGAGFEQLGDIGDYLSALIVTGGTAFIIRAQGISYATLTGNATLPFVINHLGLGDQGEGVQASSLTCQYDQIGVFVGNSNIYQISGSVSTIGDKIKAAFFTALTTLNMNAFLSAAAVSIYQGSDEFPVIVFGLGTSYYLFNPANNTWTKFTTQGAGLNEAFNASILGVFAGQNLFASSDSYQQTQLVIANQVTATVTPFTISPPTFVGLSEKLVNGQSTSNASFIVFPQEECLLGRDVTIDALYLSLYASVSQDTVLTFSFNGLQPSSLNPDVYEPVNQVFAVVTLSSSVFTTLSGNPVELQVFPTTTSTAGAFTVHSPQLRIDFTTLVGTGNAQFRFTKVGIFASYDPTQRPV